MASPPGLDKLPPELLHHICQYLEADFRRASLFAFSLTSRRYSLATAPYRLKRIRLRATGPSRLINLVHWWEDTILRKHECQPHIKQIMVSGYIQADDPIQSDGNDVSEHGDDHEDDEEPQDDFLRPLRKDWRPCSFHMAPLTAEAKQRQRAAWAPFSRFISKLPNLTDLMYSCQDPVPTILLETLQKTHPKCNLHVLTLTLRSLHQDLDKPEDMARDEYDLVKSPQLYSIAAHIDPHWEPDNRCCFTLQAVWISVKSSPSLRRLQVYCSVDKRPYPPPLAWRGPGVDMPLTVAMESRGRLEYLSIGHGHGYLAEPPVVTPFIEEYTDITQLQSLEIDHTLMWQDFNTLVDLAVEQRLRNLRALRIDPQNGDQPVAFLMHHLRPLESIRLSGHIAAQTMHAIVRHHGRSLRQLHFEPEVPEWDDIALICISALAAKCRNLKDLKILIPRTGGDKDEVQLYSALGSLPQIESITLRLKCDTGERPLPMPFASRFPFTTRPRLPWPSPPRENLGTAMGVGFLVNAAIDTSVCRLMFRIISIFHSHLRAPNPSSFQWLKVEPVGTWGDVLLDMTDHWMFRKWVCRRDLPRGQELMVREIFRQKRMARDLGYEKTDRAYLCRIRDDLCQKARRDLWRTAKGMIPDLQEDST